MSSHLMEAMKLLPGILGEKEGGDSSVLMQELIGGLTELNRITVIFAGNNRKLVTHT